MSNNENSGCFIGVLLYILVYVPIIVLISNYLYSIPKTSEYSIYFTWSSLLIGLFAFNYISDVIASSGKKYKGTLRFIIVYVFTIAMFVSVTVYQGVEVPKWNTDDFRWNYMIYPAVVSFILVSSIKLLKTGFAGISKESKTEFNLKKWVFNKIIAPIVVSLITGAVSYFFTGGDAVFASKITIISFPINLILKD